MRMKKAGIALGLLLVFFFGYAYFFVQSHKPEYDFQLQSDAVSAPVEVVFDDMAVPHIYAESERDAMFALGYVHASERLWQMDLLRRAGAGELSALLGEDMVPNDRYLRTLGMRQAADRVTAEFLDHGPERIKEGMSAYLAGVNRFIEESRTPLEYELLGMDPEPFDTHDVYCATGFMAYSFAIHLKFEPILDWMKLNLDPKYFEDLATGVDGFTTIPVTGSPADARWDSLMALIPVTASAPTPVANRSASDISGIASRVHRLDALRPVPQWLGSNAWVIGQNKTASGKVIFCNDAHMAFAQPSVWYEAHIVCPEVEYYGNHLAGLPFPAIGHTRHHSWGITMFENDDIDLYRETIEADRYLHGGEWRDLDIRTETIKVAGGDPVTFDIRSTHHGPLIEDSVAMWWTFTQYPENRIHEAFFGFSRAQDMGDVEAAASIMHAPGINLMYGDSSGNVAWWACAKLPVRPEGLDTKTAIDGTDPANDYNDWLPFRFNPKSVNPESGYVYSANNAPDSVAGRHYPGHYYSGNTRGVGIVDAIESKDDWTLAEAQDLQLDHHSRVYAQNCTMLVALLDASEKALTADQAAAVAALRQWDGSHLAAQTEPTLYYRWMYRTIEGIMADEFKQAAGDSGDEKFEAWHKTVISENTFPRLLRNPGSHWWDDVTTERIDSPADIVADAFMLAFEDLSRALGGQGGWRYDRLHTATHPHAMTDVPVLGDWLNVGPYGLPAAKDALCKYEFKLKKAVDYTIFSGPSKRIGIDFADVDGAESILPTGQSGNVFSPFYDNQAPLYHSGQFRKMRMDRSDIEAHTTAVASIRPQTER